MTTSSTENHLYKNFGDHQPACQIRRSYDFRVSSWIGIVFAPPLHRVKWVGQTARVK